MLACKTQNTANYCALLTVSRVFKLGWKIPGHMMGVMHLPTTAGRCRAVRFSFNVHMKILKQRLSCYGFVIRCARMDYAIQVGLQSFSKWNDITAKHTHMTWLTYGLGINGRQRRRNKKTPTMSASVFWKRTANIEIRADLLGSASSDLEQALTLLRIISGARYSGVPHSVQVRPFTLFAKPKSVTWEGEETTLQRVCTG